MLDRLAERPELDLTVLYAGDSVQRRTWTIEPRHRAVVLERRARPGPLPRAPARLPALARRLRRARGQLGPRSSSSPAGARSRRRPPCCVVPALPGAVRAPRREQRARRAPGLAPRGQGGGRPAGRPRRGRGARRRPAGARGDARPRRRRRSGSRVFANTIDVAAFGAASRPPRRRDATSCAPRSASGPTTSPCSRVARLAPEKGLDTLVRAVAAAGDAAARPPPRRRRARARAAR